jgi:hypothetical protein
VLAIIAKVLTFVTVYEHMGRHATSMLKKSLRVSTTAAAVKGGTHAMLQSGDTLTVRQLLYALMLPSGNDAAVALAEFFGRRMLAADGVATTSVELAAAAALLDAEGKASKDDKLVAATAAVARFVREMNAVGVSLGMNATTMHDPHGMRSASGRNNKSCVRDVVVLMTRAHRIPIFAKVNATSRAPSLLSSVTPLANRNRSVVSLCTSASRILPTNAMHPRLLGSGVLDSDLALLQSDLCLPSLTLSPAHRACKKNKRCTRPSSTSAKCGAKRRRKCGKSDGGTQTIFSGCVPQTGSRATVARRGGFRMCRASECGALLPPSCPAPQAMTMVL